jgi:hypothetical protein
MTGEFADSSSSEEQPKTSVLITIRTPGDDAPICRLGNSEEILGDATVRQLIQRVINPNSLFAVGVPASQLQAESSTALAIGELLSAECCEVYNGAMGEKNGEPVGLAEPIRAVAQEQVGDQGNRFLNVTLDVRAAADSSVPEGEDRRELSLPETVEVEHVGVASPVGLEQAALSEADTAPSEEPFEAPLGTAIETEPEAAGTGLLPRSEPVETAFSPSFEPVEATLPAASEPVEATLPAASEPVEATLPAASEPVEATLPAASEPVELDPSTSPEPAQAAVSAPSVGSSGIVAIVAQQVREQPEPEAKPERADYVRKGDWLRAQFLPEVEALDFSGLFVGNLGLGIRQEQTRREVVMTDPARVTDILLRANGYRRSGEHAKALICYQELVDMDPGNADFRFLLGKTLMELGQREDAVQAFTRAKELGHEGAGKELEQLSQSGNGNRRPLSFLRFWKQ